MNHLLEILCQINKKIPLLDEHEIYKKCQEHFVKKTSDEESLKYMIDQISKMSEHHVIYEQSGCKPIFASINLDKKSVLIEILKNNTVIVSFDQESSLEDTSSDKETSDHFESDSESDVTENNPYQTAQELESHSQSDIQLSDSSLDLDSSLDSDNDDNSFFDLQDDSELSDFSLDFINKSLLFDDEESDDKESDDSDDSLMVF
jgi:hypothetical protein